MAKITIEKTAEALRVELVNLQHQTNAFILLNPDIQYDLEQQNDIDLLLTNFNQKHLFKLMRQAGWERVPSVKDVKLRFFFTKKIYDVEVQLDFMSHLIIRKGNTNFIISESIRSTTTRGLQVLEKQIYLRYYAIKVVIYGFESERVAKCVRFADHHDLVLPEFFTEKCNRHLPQIKKVRVKRSYFHTFINILRKSSFERF